MKADRIVKFGIATDETQRIVELHHTLMEERAQVADGVIAQNVRTAYAMRALLNCKRF